VVISDEQLGAHAKPVRHPPVGTPCCTPGTRCAAGGAGWVRGSTPLLIALELTKFAQTEPGIAGELRLGCLGVDFKPTPSDPKVGHLNTSLQRTSSSRTYVPNQVRE